MRLNKTVSQKSGLPPGSLIHVGSKTDIPTRITESQYANTQFHTKTLESADEISTPTANAVQWLLIEGLSDTKVIQDIGRKFGIHELILEDILNTHQRPKCEDHDDYLYIVLKHFTVENEPFTIHSEQISLLIFEQQIIVFREYADNLFHPIQQRLSSKKSLIKALGADYFGYVVLDYIVDLYFNFNEIIEEKMEAIEEMLLESSPSHSLLEEIQTVRKQLSKARRYISPLLELNSALMRIDTSLITKESRVYFKDVSDHILRVVEASESHRETLSELVALYMTMQNNKMNDVMKVLTLFSTIFIPLTFVTGIYGMNFDFMPELKLHWAYPALLIFFAFIATGAIALFKRKKWF